MIKKLIILVLLCLTFTGAWAQIAQGFCGAEDHGPDVRWAITGTEGDYTLTITKVGPTGYMRNFETSTKPWDDYKLSVTHIVIGEGVASVGDCSFTAFRNLQTVEFHTGLEFIGTAAFCNCSSLQSVTFPASLEAIYRSAFEGCSSLQSITFEEGSQLKNIWESAFIKCNNGHLTSIELPASMEIIDNRAFNQCSHLESVTIHAPSLTFYGRGAFLSIARNFIIYVPAASVDEYRENWQEYEERIMAIGSGAVGTLKASDANNNGKRYDLLGRKQNSSQRKGLYIIGDKKAIIQ